jgi:hypothetical protein
MKATDDWNIDIIVMSFGVNTGWNEQISDAIKHAAGRSVIMFAAASNYGDEEASRTFPATENEVICVHACKGDGAEVGFSPQPEDGDYNFTTLGVSLPLIWDSEEVFKSGTSFATPIAAAFAANVLEIVTRREILPARRIFCGQGMETFFKLMSKKRHSGYRRLVPWRLWKENSHAEARIKHCFGVGESEPNVAQGGQVLAKG